MAAERAEKCIFAYPLSVGRMNLINSIPMESVKSQLPESFVRQMERLLPSAECEALLAALAGEPPVSVRSNPFKRAGQEAEREPVPWCAEGGYLSERPQFTFDPLFHAGCYYVQEASSMFVEQAFRQLDEVPRRVLDLCAAPGGKSTLWRSLLPDGALLVANEPLRQRAQVLVENLAKWGHPDVAVTQAYPADFAPLAGFFDVVAADVPCSGEGMFRKDAGAVEEWSPEAVVQCADRQWQIVNDVWPALREGGYLVYSTCTFNRLEDEDNVERICRELGAEPVPIACPESWGVSGDTTGRGLPVYHFYPHRTRGEGFFLALLRKTSAAPVARERKKARAVREQPVAGGATVARWLKQGDRFKLFRPDDAHIAAVRQTLADDFRRLRETVRTLSAGILLAEEKGRKLIPQHELALSVERAAEAFPQVELPYAQAVAYLRREAVVLPPEVPRGYVVVTYEGRALGFANNLGARANNLYPAEWRIRSAAPQGAGD